LPVEGLSIVTITNSMGMSVFNKTYSLSGTVVANLNSLSAGLYYIKISNGKNNYNSKLVKTK
jgi:hypothetical protein